MTDMNPDYQFGQPEQPTQPVQPTTPYPGQGVPQLPVQQPGYTAPQPEYTPQPGHIPQAGYPPVQPPVNNYITPPKQSKKWLIIAIVFIATTIAAMSVGVWAYMNYLDQRDNTDAKISTAVTAGVKDQADKDAADFLEKEKQPNRQFAGPDDYGRLSFDYPKTWSIYVSNAALSGGTYEAYFNPVSVPPVGDEANRYALRVSIEQQAIEQVIANYDTLVQDNSLKATAVKAGGTDGTRLDGKFTENIRGSAVIFKIRDKTVTIRSDAETFKGDFDALIATITFNK